MFTGLFWNAINNRYFNEFPSSNLLSLLLLVLRTHPVKTSPTGGSKILIFENEDIAAIIVVSA
jgi:hypothetical protein